MLPKPVCKFLSLLPATLAGLIFGSWLIKLQNWTGVFFFKLKLSFLNKDKAKCLGLVRSLLGLLWQQGEQQSSVGWHSEKTLSQGCCGSKSACPGTANRSRADTHTHRHIQDSEAQGGSFIQRQILSRHLQPACGAGETFLQCVCDKTESDTTMILKLGWEKSWNVTSALSQSVSEPAWYSTICRWNVCQCVPPLLYSPLIDTDIFIQVYLRVWTWFKPPQAGTNIVL